VRIHALALAGPKCGRRPGPARVIAFKAIVRLRSGGAFPRRQGMARPDAQPAIRFVALR
jgi:hypothetical protein